MRSKIRIVFLFLTVLLILVSALYVKVTGAQSTNLVPNASVETVDPADANLPQQWLTDQWGTNTPTFTYVNNDGHSGSRSVKVQITSYTSGDAKWYYAPQAVTPGKTYTISDYYKSNIKSRVVIMFNMPDDTQQYIELAQAPASATSWAAYSSQVTAPANSVSMSVFHLISKVG